MDNVTILLQISARPRWVYGGIHSRENGWGFCPDNWPLGAESTAPAPNARGGCSLDRHQDRNWHYRLFSVVYTNSVERVPHANLSDPAGNIVIFAHDLTNEVRRHHCCGWHFLEVPAWAGVLRRAWPQRRGRIDDDAGDRRGRFPAHLRRAGHHGHGFRSVSSAKADLYDLARPAHVQSGTPNGMTDTRHDRLPSRREGQ